MTFLGPLWLRVIEAVCSDELRTNILEPALADLAYLRRTSRLGPWRLLLESWRIVLTLSMALAGDLILHHRPSRGTILRTVVAIACPGLTPSCGTTNFVAGIPKAGKSITARP